METTRRGFLGIVGKFAAALGIAAVAPSVLRHMEAQAPIVPLLPEALPLTPAFGARYVVANYSLGDVIPQEDWDEDQYGVIHRYFPSQGGSFARAFDQQKSKFAEMWYSPPRHRFRTVARYQVPVGCEPMNPLRALSASEAALRASV